MARKITDEDLANRGVMGLPDVPGLTAIEMQKKLEEIPREVIIPRYNELVDSVADICEEFSKLSTYDVGDYCIYENVLYKCTTAITTEGEWDATKWKATSIDKELKEISSYTANKDVISDKYDSSKTYSVGDYCIYDDTLYKCKTAVTSAEEFDSSKWEATNCGKELVALNSNLKWKEIAKDSTDWVGFPSTCNDICIIAKYNEHSTSIIYPKNGIVDGSAHFGTNKLEVKLNLYSTGVSISAMTVDGSPVQGGTLSVYYR